MSRPTDAQMQLVKSFNSPLLDMWIRNYEHVEEQRERNKETRMQLQAQSKIAKEQGEIERFRALWKHHADLNQSHAYLGAKITAMNLVITFGIKYYLTNGTIDSGYTDSLRESFQNRINKINDEIDVLQALRNEAVSTPYDDRTKEHIDALRYGKQNLANSNAAAQGYARSIAKLTAIIKTIEEQNDTLIS